MRHPVYLMAALAVFFLAAACGQVTATPDPASRPTAPAEATEEARVTKVPIEASTTSATEVGPSPEDAGPPDWRYVNSGWVVPVDTGTVDAFTQELRAFVITSQEEFDAFSAGFTPRRTRGTSASLGRIEFEDSILLGAYYLWRPVQGDPFSVVGFSVEGNQARVELELVDEAQGRLRPYLMAPMTIVAVDKGKFPAGETVDFLFKINGKPSSTVRAAIN